MLGFGCLKKRLTATTAQLSKLPKQTLIRNGAKFKVTFLDLFVSKIGNFKTLETQSENETWQVCAGITMVQVTSQYHLTGAESLAEGNCLLQVNSLKFELKVVVVATQINTYVLKTLKGTWEFESVTVIDAQIVKGHGVTLPVVRELLPLALSDHLKKKNGKMMSHLTKFVKREVNEVIKGKTHQEILTWAMENT